MDAIPRRLSFVVVLPYKTFVGFSRLMYARHYISINANKASFHSENCVVTDNKTLYKEDVIIMR